MNCHLVQKNIDAYLDAELLSRDSLQLEAHLRDCDSCRLALHAAEVQKRTARRALEMYPRITAKPDFDLRVLAAITYKPVRVTIFDRLDMIFARPLPKIVGASAAGLTFCFVLTSSLVPHKYASQELVAGNPGNSMVMVSNDGQNMNSSQDNPLNNTTIYAMNGSPYDWPEVPLLKLPVPPNRNSVQREKPLRSQTTLKPPTSV
jgi:hypothetical protein